MAARSVYPASKKKNYYAHAQKLQRSVGGAELQLQSFMAFWLIIDGGSFEEFCLAHTLDGVEEIGKGSL